MLARYLRTSQARPVRYALPHQFPPDLSEAIRNYLMLSLRGANVPHLHHQAQGVLQPFYQEHPAAQGAMQGLLGQQPHPSDLLAFLDLLHEHGGAHIPAEQMYAGYSHEESPPAQQMLLHMRNLSRPLTGDLMSPQSPVRAFGTEQLRGLEPILRRLGMDHPGVPLAAGSLYRSLQGSYGSRFKNAYDTVGQSIDHLRHGRPEGLLPLYDTAHDVAATLGHHAQTAVAADANYLRNQTANLIHRTLIPHLYENQP